ncbi:MAG: hypothetical protein HKN92_01075 [Chitinophagales bacterium]|nr:hypothetical protein [Chitinophagales bacterium]
MLRVIVAVTVILSFSACEKPTQDPSQKITGSGITSNYTIDDSSFEYTNFWNQYYSYNGLEYIILFKNSGKVNRADLHKQSVYDIQVLGPENNEMWNANISAHEIEIERDLLIAQFFGDDSHEDTYEYYNLSNGEKLIDFTSIPMTISIPNSTDKRFIGVLSRNSNKENLANDKLGVLTFASNNRKIDRIDILAANKEIAEQITRYTPDMSFVLEDSSNRIIDGGRGLILWNADKDYTTDMIGGFKIKLYFFTEENEVHEILIPVKNDEIQFTGIVYDKEYFKLKRK